MRTLRTDCAGMTLVELLVVLAILAGLAMVAVVATAGLRERANVEETIRQGEALCDAIDRDEGLSFVSDFGFAPTNLGQLVALRQRVYDPDVAFTDDGTLEASAIRVALPVFAEVTAPLLPTNHVADDEVLRKATNGYDCVRLGAGWRGPYFPSRIALVDDTTWSLADPWRGAWELNVTNDLITMTSLGRDRVRDTEDVTPLWQDRDRLFTTHPIRSASLHVTVHLADVADVLRFYVFVHSPSLYLPESGAVREAEMEVANVAKSTTGTGEATLDFTGCAVGMRVLYAYATDGTQVYSAPPRTVRVAHGDTSVTLYLSAKD